MIITISENRRILHTGFGWKIEKRVQKKEGGEFYWTEDRPAYPTRLSQALEYCLEREFTDQGDMDISEAPAALTKALKTLQACIRQARAIAA